MKKTGCLTTFLLFVVIYSLNCQNMKNDNGKLQSINNAKDYFMWNSFYYIEKSNELLKCAMIYCSNSILTYNDVFSTTAYIFYGEIFRTIDNLVDLISDDLLLNDSDLVFFCKALSYANTEISKLIIENYIDQNKFGVKNILIDIHNRIIPNVYQITIDSSNSIERVWQAFYATGNTNYIIKLIKALKSDYMVYWVKKTLIDNKTNHPLVMKTLVDCIENKILVDNDNKIIKEIEDILILNSY